MPILRFQRLTEPDDPLLQQALAVYEMSFPYHERRERASQRALLQDPLYHFDLLMREGAPVGALLYWQQPSFTYAEHFFIFPEHRGRGIGSAALEQLCRCTVLPLILEIDPPDDELSRRRLRFYERNGFRLTPHDHRQPAYHADTGGESLRVLSYPYAINASEYEVFRHFLTQHAMRNAF